MAKRERDDDAFAAAVQELESVADRSTASDLKLKALGAIDVLVDGEDESYEAQRALVEEGLVATLPGLLQDESEAVAAAAAHTVATLAAQSSTVLTRLEHGATTGYAETADKVNVNPVQSALGDSAVIKALVELSFGNGGEAAEAARTALSTLARYNRENKLTYVHHLVNRLKAGDPQAVEALEGVVPGMDGREDAAVVLDQALLPLVALAGDASAPALGLLATLLEQRPVIAEFLRAEGAAAVLARQVAGGGPLPVRDAAARALWLLARRAKGCLTPAALGLEPRRLVDPLLDLVTIGAAEELDEEGGNGDGEGGGGEQSGGEGVDNSDDALLLLKALAAADRDAREAIKGHPAVAAASCTLM